jgi:hypothetical protein
MRHRSIITAVLVGATLAAAPAAPAQDLRSPDARDSSRQTSAGFDLRSPDAREFRDPFDTLVGSPAPAPSPSPAVIVEPDGFDVVDAFIGALAALVLAGAVVALTGMRRRRVVGAVGS